MTQMKTFTKTALGLAALLVSSAALGAPQTQVFKVADGYGGPKSDNGGAGNEQESAAVVHATDGSTYLVVVGMSSKVPDEDRPYQCKMWTFKMDPFAGPQLVVNALQLTHNDGNRPCNHPKITSDGQQILMVYGTNDRNQSTVRAYAQLYDHMGNALTDRLRISENGNNNEGAPDVAWNGGEYFTAGYLSTGNNDTSFAVGLTKTMVNGQWTLTKTWLKGVVAPSNIGRPAIVGMGMQRSLFCASKGDNRPPEDGVQCAVLDSMTGEILNKDYVARSEPGNDIYMNSPEVANMGGGRYAVMAIESTGEGRRHNRKGTSRAHLYTLEPTDGALGIRSDQPDVGVYQAHSALCSGAYGEDGMMHAGVFDASITGSGVPMLTAGQYDFISRTFTMRPGRVVGSENGDSGYIANLYGNNPNTQGRDFLRCIGDVPNPGYGVDGGYLPEVKTFFVTPYAGMVAGEPKNSLFVSFVPAWTPAIPPPAPGEDDPGNPPSDPSSPDDGSDPTAPADPGNPPGNPGTFGGCSLSGASHGSADAGWLLLLGLALAAPIVRRRRAR